MPRKITLFHREIETKTLLEAAAIQAIFVLLLAGIYVLEPAITGFVTVVKQVNHTDEVNLEFSENSEYAWNPENAGDLTSIKISGSKSKPGQAKVYIENNGARHLVFDSSLLVEKPSGIFGVTGFAVKEDKEGSYVLLSQGKNSKIVKQRVKIGITNENKAEIISGVGIEDKIIIINHKVIS